MRSEGLCNRIVSEVSKRLKDPLFGPFWGTSKKGSFYPISVGSEIGSKVEVLVCNGFSWYGVKDCATESVKN